MEHCDAPPLLLFSHSLGGGTGSGLGTRLCEEAADEVSMLHAFVHHAVRALLNLYMHVHAIIATER